MTFFNGRRSKKTRDYNNLSMMLYETETERERGVFTAGTMNFPVSKQIAGRVQYARRGIDVIGYTIVLIYAILSSSFKPPP